MERTGLKFPCQWMVLVLVFVLDVSYHGAEGRCSLEHCTNRTTCVVMKDQRSCKCASGYYGDRCDQDAEITVVCGENYIEVRALEEFFNYYKAKLASLHLPNRECRSNETTINGKKYYYTRTSKEDYSRCGGKPFEKNFTHIKYSLKLSSDPEVTGNIIRDSTISLEYSCTFPYTRTVSLDFPIVPFSNETLMRVHDLDATVKMLLYTDETYTNPIVASPVIELGEKVYVEVVVAEPPNFFRMLVGKCWATQYNLANHTNGSHHILIEHGCKKDHTVSFKNQTVNGANGESSTVHFDFDMFRFTTEPDHLFLHCSVQLCEPNDMNSCKPNCHSVAKREAVRADPAQGLLSYGPIRIKQPQTSHSSVLATVVLPVAAVWTVGLFLVILIIVAKAGSRRLAKLDEPQYQGSGQLQ